MAVSLYMDVHIPMAITRQLRLRGVDVLTATEGAPTSWTMTPFSNSVESRAA